MTNNIRLGPYPVGHNFMRSQNKQQRHQEVKCLNVSKHATTTIPISTQGVALLCSPNEFEFEKFASQRFNNESAE